MEKLNVNNKYKIFVLLFGKMRLFSSIIKKNEKK